MEMAVDQVTHESGRAAYFEFVETFLELGERRRYASTLFRIGRRPIKNAFALLAEVDLRTATRFLQQSVVLYLALGVTSALAGSDGGLVDELFVSVSLLVSTSVELAIFYRLARSHRTQERNFREFLSFAAITLGFSLPLAAVGVQLMLTADPTLWAAGLGAWLFVLVYTVRVWQRFWGLSAKRATAYLFVAAAVSSFVPAIA
jgi:hypothetical protein